MSLRVPVMIIDEAFNFGRIVGQRRNKADHPEKIMDSQEYGWSTSRLVSQTKTQQKDTNTEDRIWSKSNLPWWIEDKEEMNLGTSHVE